MIKTRIASGAALFTFGLAALGGTFLTIAAPANASTGAASTSSAEPSTHTSSGAPAIPIARPKPADPNVGQPFSKDPYPQVNPFPSLPGNPWA